MPNKEQCEQFIEDYFSNSEPEDRPEVVEEFKQLTKDSE